MEREGGGDRGESTDDSGHTFGGYRFAPFPRPQGREPGRADSGRRCAFRLVDEAVVLDQFGRGSERAGGADGDLSAFGDEEPQIPEIVEARVGGRTTLRDDCIQVTDENVKNFG